MGFRRRETVDYRIHFRVEMSNFFRFLKICVSLGKPGLYSHPISVLRLPPVEMEGCPEQPQVQLEVELVLCSWLCDPVSTLPSRDLLGVLHAQGVQAIRVKVCDRRPISGSDVVLS